MVKLNFKSIKKPIKILFVFLFLIACSMACQNKEELLLSGGAVQPFRFNVDTLKFDTVLVNQRTITKRLIATNTNDQAIIVKSVALENPSGIFRLRYNGEIKQSFQDLFLRGSDSLTLLIDAIPTTISKNQPTQVIENILLETDAGIQKIPFEIYPWNIIEIKEERVQSATTWKKEQPILLTKNLLVEKNVTLTIEPGTTIFAKKEVFLFVQGTLKGIGMPGDSITFRNDRLDKQFLEAPGQWGGLIFLPGSTNNELSYFLIENATVGLNLDTADADNEPEIKLSQGVIRYIATTGILTIGADLVAQNLLIYDCENQALGHFAGGNYQYNHCTFSNQNRLFINDSPGFIFTNILEQENQPTLSNAMSLVINNSILWGDGDEEIIFDNRGVQDFNLTIGKNIFKTTQSILINDTETIVEDPKFKDVRADDFSLEEGSKAIDAAINGSIVIDLKGNSRDATPDLGALEVLP